ncbi:MAG: c-type cytochrome biogenesis protein CcmI/CycH [Acidobacteriota bacterium]
MTQNRSIPTRALILLSALTLLGCSQHEVSWKGDPPEAPKEARAARPVQKDAPQEASPMPEPAPATAAAGADFSGTVDLPSNLAAGFQRGPTLFVIARSSAGDMRPVAAVKLLPESFPVAFRITGADSMTGEPLPEEADLLVRLDEDGDISTRSEKDLSAGPVRARAGEPVSLLLGGK